MGSAQPSQANHAAAIQHKNASMDNEPSEPTTSSVRMKSKPKASKTTAVSEAASIFSSVPPRVAGAIVFKGRGPAGGRVATVQENPPAAEVFFGGGWLKVRFHRDESIHRSLAFMGVPLAIQVQLQVELAVKCAV